MALRGSLKKYILVLCGCYLFFVLIFHSRIQLNMPLSQEKSSRDAENMLQEEGDKYPGLVIQEGIANHPAKLHLQQYKQAVKESAKKPLRNNNLNEHNLKFKHKDIVVDGKAQFENDMDEDLSEDSCMGPSVESQIFHETAMNVWMYSAYWDNRYNDFDNKDNNTYLRIMSIGQQRSKKPMQCIFEINDRIVKVPLTYYEMCENHNRGFGGYILSCQVPKEVAKQKLCSVLVSSADKTISGNPPLSKRVPVYGTKPKAKRHNFAVCVSPLFGNINLFKLIEWIELSAELGADKITFYDFDLSPAVLSVLKYYVKLDMVEILPWKIEQRVDKSIWYHGQIIAIQDCLYHNMAVADHVAFYDLDEFIIPYQHSTWQELVDSQQTDQTCAFQFHSAFFDPNRQDPYVGNANHSYLFTQVQTKRTAILSKIRTKCMVCPYLIFEAGIHHISKPILADLKVVPMDDPEIAFLHHYRGCMANFGMNCKDFKQDTEITKYGSTLHMRTSKIFKELNMSPYS